MGPFWGLSLGLPFNKTCKYLYCALCQPERWGVGRFIWDRIYKLFKEAKNGFQGINSASLCSLAGRYDNPIPTRFLAAIDCLKIPALSTGSYISPVLLGKEWTGWRNSSGGGRYIEWKGVKHWPPQESIEFFIEDHDFSSLYVLAPPPLPSSSCLSFTFFLCVAGRAYWRERGVGRVGEEPNHTRNSDPLYTSQYSLTPTLRPQRRLCRKPWLNVPKTVVIASLSTLYSLVCGASLPSWFLWGFPDKMVRWLCTITCKPVPANTVF